MDFEWNFVNIDDDIFIVAATFTRSIVSRMFQAFTNAFELIPPNQIDQGTVLIKQCSRGIDIHAPLPKFDSFCEGMDLSQPRPMEMTSTLGSMR